ncbi:MAG TPA: beta-phosphoglucomutase, partial [Prevotella sp.]|nr:beta-phosphoglucomutase [Prevotella sp.]
LNDFGTFLDESHIVSAYDVKQGKPNPEPYLMGLKKTGNLKPNEAIVIENAPLGIRAGVAANIFTVAVNSGPLSNEALLCEGANILYSKIKSFAKDWDKFIK